MVLAVLASASLGLSQQTPMGRGVTSALKSSAFHKRLQPIQLVSVLLLPIAVDALAHPSQDMTGQTLHSDPRQDGHIRQEFYASRACITPTTPMPGRRLVFWRADDRPARCTFCCRT